MFEFLKFEILIFQKTSDGEITKNKVRGELREGGGHGFDTPGGTTRISCGICDLRTTFAWWLPSGVSSD
jgi:hypothetical protein